MFVFKSVVANGRFKMQIPVGLTKINQRRRDGQSVCVRIQIDDIRAYMVLTTPACDGGSGGNRPPNEREILDLWEKHGLNKNEFAPANLLAFLNQLIRLIGD
jgi:hypothetical protein